MELPSMEYLHMEMVKEQRDACSGMETLLNDLSHLSSDSVLNIPSGSEEHKWSGKHPRRWKSMSASGFMRQG